MERYVPLCGCLQEALGGSHLLLLVRFLAPNQPPKKKKKKEINFKNLARMDERFVGVQGATDTLNSSAG